jgi:hypothetical protein
MLSSLSRYSRYFRSLLPLSPRPECSPPSCAAAATCRGRSCSSPSTRRARRLDGTLIEGLKARADAMLAEPENGLRAEEVAIMAYLTRRIGEEAAAKAA